MDFKRQLIRQIHTRRERACHTIIFALFNSLKQETRISSHIKERQRVWKSETETQRPTQISWDELNENRRWYLFISQVSSIHPLPPPVPFALFLYHHWIRFLCFYHKLKRRFYYNLSSIFYICHTNGFIIRAMGIFHQEYHIVLSIGWMIFGVGGSSSGGGDGDGGGAGAVVTRESSGMASRCQIRIWYLVSIMSQMHPLDRLFVFKLYSSVWFAFVLLIAASRNRLPSRFFPLYTQRSKRRPTQKQQQHHQQ